MKFSDISQIFSLIDHIFTSDLMDSNVLGVIYSYILVILGIIIGFIISHHKRVHPEIVRKFIHIFVSNWWYIYAYYFTDLVCSVVVPITFIIANAAATFLNLTNYFGLVERKRNYGLIYFPVSLTILSILYNYHVLEKFAIGIGILAMGYGDGFAAVIGIYHGKHKIKFTNNRKSYEGSILMFLTTFAISIAFVLHYGVCNDTFKIIIGSIFVSATATFVEMITTMGLDNISVPIITALVANFLFKSI